MRRRTAISLIAACAISACAHQTTPPTAAALEGMRWIEVEGDDPKLAFGLPDSDVMVVMMTCQPRSGQVAIALFGDPGRSRAVELRSGRAAQRLAAITMPSALHDQVVETAAPAAGPVLASFARTGELAVGVGGPAMLLPAADREISGRFVANCL